MGTEQTIGRRPNAGIQPVTGAEVQTEVITDHTGARHIFPIYDPDQAYKDALAARGVIDGKTASPIATQKECLWPGWNDDVRGKEWG